MHSSQSEHHKRGVSVSAKNLVFSFGAKTVLDGASFTVDDSRRSCLVGKNGSGKSTLLRILAGELSPEAGKLVTSNLHYSVVYVPQVVPKPPDGIGALDFLLSRPEQQSAPADNAPPAGHPPPWPGTSGNAGGPWDAEHLASARARAKKDLSAFVGLRRGQHNTPLRALSGGQKTRLFILRALTLQPDLLLLDEPDNNLDRSGRRWLIDSIRAFPHTVLVVGHRAGFIEEIAERILELDHSDHKVYTHTCSYQDYLEFKAARADLDEKERLRVEKERRRLKATIQKELRLARRSQRGARQPKDRDKMGAEHKSARATKKHQSQAAKLARRLAQLPQADESRTPPLRIHIEPAHCGQTVLLIRGLSKSYDKPLFQDFSIRITNGQRVAIVGPNASGKTTLLKVIAGMAQPDAGEVRLGRGVVLGYFPQEQEGLPDRTVLAHLRRTISLDETSLRRELHHYQFTEDKVLTEIPVLSAGERARLFLVQFALNNANLLLLDEPTNNLDPDSRARLADSLAHYAGTLLVASHDRDLLEAVSPERTLCLGEGGIRLEYGRIP